MPIYEYVCGKCKTRFELMRPISKSGDAADCPSCKGQAKRIMSKFACFSPNEMGDMKPISGAGGCATCGSTNCSTCNN